MRNNHPHMVHSHWWRHISERRLTITYWIMKVWIACHRVVPGLLDSFWYVAWPTRVLPIILSILESQLCAFSYYSSQYCIIWHHCIFVCFCDWCWVLRCVGSSLQQCGARARNLMVGNARSWSLSIVVWERFLSQRVDGNSLCQWWLLLLMAGMI